MNSIPEIDFKSDKKEGAEFAIATSKEIVYGLTPNGYSYFKPHRIAYYAILFILEGEGEHYIDFKKYAYQKGSVVFIAKEQVHYFQERDDLKALLLTFTERFLEKSSIGSGLMQQLSLYNYRLYSPVLNLNKDQFDIFLSLLQRIKAEYDGPEDFASEEIVQSMLKVFLFLAERIRKKNLQATEKPFYLEEFMQLQRALKQYILENRQVSFYAEQLRVSSKTLNRITIEVAQQTAKQYINDFLMLELKRFLMNTNLSIKEIAYTAGFEAPTNFAKFFKHHSKVTPAEFRKQYR